jgi:hypothetical protein
MVFLFRSVFLPSSTLVARGSINFLWTQRGKIGHSDVDDVANIITLLGMFSDEWSKLLETVELRDEKLVAAGEIHRFNRDVAESLSRIQEKYVAIPDDLGRDLNSVLGLIRRHENFETDLVALEAQLQVCCHYILNLRILKTILFPIFRSWWMIQLNCKWLIRVAMPNTSELNKLW